MCPRSAEAQEFLIFDLRLAREDSFVALNHKSQIQGFSAHLPPQSQIANQKSTIPMPQSTPRQ
jgi:hypothetical protein